MAHSIPAARQFYCQTCGHVYDEALGDPDAPIAPGTRWAELPQDWCCPDCGAPKSDYIEVPQ